MPTDAALTVSEPKYSPTTGQGLRWAVVLAGGDGVRMRPLIKSWLGENRPKQYCTFTGSRSMLQHTLDRAAQLCPEERIITIVGAGHSNYLKRNHIGTVIEQPQNKGTALGVMLPIAFILDRDPDATVLILPSDHFVYPEERFNGYADQAFRLADQHSDRLIIMGAVPDGPETDYGWIEPGQDANGGNHSEVRSFLEKPSREAAQKIFDNHWLWNTMVVAVKASTLWALATRLLPKPMQGFENLRVVLRAVREERVPDNHVMVALNHIYNRLPASDFSRDILQNITRKSIVVPIEGVRWSDWGRPERIWETLTFLGVKPAMPGNGWKGRIVHPTCAPERSDDDAPTPRVWAKYVNTP